MSLWTQALVQHIIEYNTIFILYFIQFEKRRGFRHIMSAACPLFSVRLFVANSSQLDDVLV